MSHCHEHDHHHHHHDGCCSHEKQECCEEESCCESKEGKHEDFAKHLLCLADEAWMELLKDKIKENILADGGAQLDQIAKVVSEGNKSRWENKMAMKKNACEYKEKIKSLFSCESGNCKK
ncbi:MAG: hypothetical protein H0T62_14345 [Parachlamydiaceae bacterium]|nr:hypothetical protein [Parachlamydiaceae bacterium]